MGKLNYTNRKISGEKLGAAVKKDVLKYNPPANGAKARSHKDPHLDIYLQGRALGDEGLKIACDGFVQALSSGSIRLDELHLAENGITMRGLKALSEVVQLASKDIKDLDLRANNLAVVTQEDVDDWERFLRSFREVSCLRRLDISENPIGDKGYETFLRVYSREPPVHLPRTPNLDSSEDGYDTDGVDDDSDDMETFNVRPRRFSGDSRDSAINTAQTTPAKGETTGSPLSKGIILRTSPLIVRSPCRNLDLQGLRSIPYLIFSNTGITDSGALFLSYVLPLHHTPQLLMPHFPPPKAGPQAETLETYYETSCRGVVYRPNEQINGLLSTRVLELAEGMREGHSVKIIKPELNPWKLSPKKGKDPLNFTMGEMCTPPLARDLERARHKIQGSILNAGGLHCVALWSAALKVMVLSRLFLFDRGAAPYQFPRKTPAKRIPLLVTVPSYLNGPGNKGMHSPPRKMSSGFLRYEEPGSSPVVDGRALAHALASLSPTSERAQRVRGAPAQLVKCRDEANDPEGTVAPEPMATEGGNSPAVKGREVGEAKGVKCMNGSEKTNGQSAVKRKLPGGLPEPIWAKIIAMSADPEGLLSDNQLGNMSKWAKAQNTLEMERELSGKLKSAQIWRILENTGCLAYECS